jgi:hypothetical protein
MDQMKPSHQNSTIPAKAGKLSTLMRMGIKGAIGLGLMVAGAALAQNVGLVPTPNLKPIDEMEVAAPTQADLAQAPAPGSKREAQACSNDIKLLCAPETETRRDVLKCFEDKAPQVSPSCKSYLQRFADEIAN